MRFDNVMRKVSFGELRTLRTTILTICEFVETGNVPGTNEIIMLGCTLQETYMLIWDMFDKGRINRKQCRALIMWQSALYEYSTKIMNKNLYIIRR